METLNVKVENGNIRLKELSLFIEETKKGDYTKDFPAIEKITFGRLDELIPIENQLTHVDPRQFILFGLSY